MSDNAVSPFVGDDQPQNLIPRSDMERAVQEVQAALVIAQRFPRNERKSRDNILVECSRPALAAAATYQYPRGGQSVTGPSIRLAEAAARHWGNMEYGVRELSQTDEGSQMEAYAWDMQTNTRVRREFFAPNVRWTRENGATRLEDPRDVYENNANLGARRVRACVLELIPGDVIDEAVAKAQSTLKANIDSSPEGIQKAIRVLSKWNITPDHIAARYRKNVDALVAGELVDMLKIANSLKDGMSKPGDWFDMGASPTKQESEAVAAAKEAMQKDPNEGYTKQNERHDAPPMMSEDDVQGHLKSIPGYDMYSVMELWNDLSMVPKDLQPDFLKALTERKKELEGGPTEDL